MAIPDPAALAAQIETPFDFLSIHQQELFAAQRAQRELVAVREHFGGQFEPWRNLRQQIKSLNQQPLTTETLRQMSQLLKHYRQLEWRRLQWERREQRQQQLAQAQAWQTTTREQQALSPRWERWRRHQEIAHWPSQAIWRYADQILPFFQNYLQQAQQEYQQKKAQCSVFDQPRVQQFLTELAQWIAKQQQILCWGILARLRSIGTLGDVRRDDLILEVERSAEMRIKNTSSQNLSCDADQKNDFSQGLSTQPTAQNHAYQTPSTMTMETFQALTHYLFRNQPQLYADLRQLPWLHQHPAWFFCMDADGWRILPATLQAYSVSGKQWWHRWFWVKTKRVSAWLLQVQGLFIWMRLMPTLVDNNSSCTPEIAQPQWEQLQQQYQQTQQWQHQLSALIPSRWNWFYRRMRMRLIILQKQIQLHQQQNLLQQTQLSHVLIESLKTLPLTQLESLVQRLTQFKQWVATDPQYAAMHHTCQQQLTQIRTWQCQQQHQTQQAKLQQSLTDLAQQYSHEQAEQAVEMFIQLLALDAAVKAHYGSAVTNVVQQLWEAFQQVHQQVSQQLLTAATASSNEWVAVQAMQLQRWQNLFQSLSLPTLQPQIDTYFTQILFRVCQDVDQPLDQQQDLAWRTFQLHVVSNAPSPWLAQQAQRLLALEQKNFQHFKQQCHTLMNTLMGKMVTPPQVVLEQLTAHINQALRDQLKFSTRQQKTFARCCHWIEQGESATQIMAQHSRGIAWEKQSALARQLLMLWESVWQTLCQPRQALAQQESLSPMIISNIEPLQRRIIRVLPKFSLFAAGGVTSGVLPSMDAKQEAKDWRNSLEVASTSSSSPAPSRKQRVLARLKRRR